MQHLHKGFSKISMSEANELEQELSLAELTTTIEGLTTMREPSLEGLPVKYKTLWPLSSDPLHIFQESPKEGILLVSSCWCSPLAAAKQKGSW